MVRGELYESGQKITLLKRAPSTKPCGLLWKPLQYDSSLKYDLLSMTRKTLAVEPPVFPNTFVMLIDVSWPFVCVYYIFSRNVLSCLTLRCQKAWQLSFPWELLECPTLEMYSRRSLFYSYPYTHLMTQCTGDTIDKKSYGTLPSRAHDYRSSEWLQSPMTSWSAAGPELRTHSITQNCQNFIAVQDSKYLKWLGDFTVNTP